MGMQRGFAWLRMIQGAASPRREGRVAWPLLALLALAPPALFLAVVLNTPVAHAAADPTFMVNSTLDEPDANLLDLTCRSTPSGVCTLRAAVGQAQAPGGINPWTAATIVVPGGTYTLTRGQLDITAVLAALTIQGAGPAATVLDGNGDNPNCFPATALSCRVIDMKIGSTLIASGLTIRDGKAGFGESSHYHGGGIHNHGSLTLRNAVVSDNSVVNAPWGGGGITNAGGASAALENVTLSGNRAPANGGGLENLGGLSLINATVSGNTAGQSGGGLWHNSTAFSAIRYVTIALNAAPTGGGGGINRGGGVALYVTDTIVSGNTTVNCVGALTSFGRNVSSDPTCTFADPTDKNSTDPQLGGLQDNGGGLPTHRPAPTSPALDLHTTGCGGTDERGVARPQGAGCDSGAVELRTFTVALTSGPGGGATGGGAYKEGATATLAATPSPGQVFLGWTLDGVFRGWANPLTITIGADHVAQASFAARPNFPDLAGLDLATFEAIGQLAARGIIRGFVDERGQTIFAPTERTRRAQMAALIARAIPATPSDVLGAGRTWDNEEHGNGFTDRCDPSGCVDDNLWRNVGTLQARGVAGGFEAGTCVAAGLAPPCYGPFDDVLYAQVISFITRAMVAQGYWQFATEDYGHYPNVPGAFVPKQGHRVDIETYLQYAGPIPGSPDPHGSFNAYDQPSTRGWFALALWQALNSHFGQDNVP